MNVYRRQGRHAMAKFGGAPCLLTGGDTRECGVITCIFIQGYTEMTYKYNNTD